MSAKYPGKLIVFEGVNGSGKSSQITRARNWLQANYCQIPVVVTKEPTENFIGRFIRMALGNSSFLKALGPVVLQSWYALDSRQHLQEKIIPVLENGAVVLCDRYRHSLVHSAVSEANVSELFYLNKIILGKDFIIPDLVFIFDVLPATAMERLAKKGTVLDAQETLSEIVRTRKHYFKLSELWPDNVHVVDANRGEQEVFVEVRELMLTEVKKLLSP